MTDRLRHRGRAAAVVVLVALAGAGCGTDAAEQLPEAGATVRDERAAQLGSAQSLLQDEQASAPTAAGRRIAAELDRLVRGYAPVTERVNFLLTAETLRTHGIANDAGDAVLRQRFGAVQVEVGRMQRELQRARASLRAVRLTGTPQQRVRTQLLSALEARSRAMRELSQLLAAQRREDGSRQAERLQGRWEVSWGTSVAHARAATSDMQQLRARGGVAPAPEESFR